MTQPELAGGSNVNEGDYCCGEGQSLGGCGGAYTDEDLDEPQGMEKAPDVSQGLFPESES